MTFFIYGIRPETMTLVARFPENQYRQDLTFERLIQFAKDEGDSFRAMAPRLGTPRPSIGKPKPLAAILRIPRATPRSPLPNQQVAFLHEGATQVGSAQYTHEGVSEQPDGREEALVVEETNPANSIATSDLPPRTYESASSAQDATDAGISQLLLWLERDGYARKREVRRVYPPAILHENARSNRVGWLAKVICYLCYERGHLTADCTSGIRDMPKVISNFEKLSESEKTSVPDTYYQNDLCFVLVRPQFEPKKDVSDASQSKN